MKTARKIKEIVALFLICLFGFFIVRRSRGGGDNKLNRNI